MTFRAKPVVKRTHRPSWESQDRRNFYLNLGFGIVVVVAVLILAHRRRTVLVQRPPRAGRQRRRPVASPRTSFATAGAIETWRLDEAERRIRDRGRGRPPDRGAGRDVQQQFIDAAARAARAPSRSSASSTTGSRPTSPRQEGVTVTDADIDARLVERGDDPGGAPRLGHRGRARVTDRRGRARPPRRSPTAKAKAEAALRDLQAGKPWDDIAKTVSTDTSTAPQAGDLGWLQADDSQADEAFLRRIVRGRGQHADRRRRG